MRLCNAQLRSTCNVKFFMSQFTAGTCSEHQLIAGASHLTHLLHAFASPPPPPKSNIFFASQASLCQCTLVFPFILNVPVPMHVVMSYTTVNLSNHKGMYVMYVR